MARTIGGFEPPEVITRRVLQRWGICIGDYTLFDETFPRGARVTRSNILKASKADLDIRWFAEQIHLIEAWTRDELLEFMMAWQNCIDDHFVAAEFMRIWRKAARRRKRELAAYEEKARKRRKHGRARR